MPAGTPAPSGPIQSHWLWVLCLIGLDYFSTLGYQPSIAYEAAGLLAPIATLVVVAVTLFCALPVYAQVAARSPNGQGAIGLLERLVPGWVGKALILVLLGFAATDFIFTRTLSVADAAVHLTHNPSAAWQRTLDFLFDTGNRARPFLEHSLGQALMDLWNRQMVVTLVLLLVGFVFWAYFRRRFMRRVIQLSVVVVGVYLFLSALVIGSGLYYLADHGDILRAWYDDVASGRWQIHHPSLAAKGWAGIGAVSLLLFPKLALGLSGFEMSMVVMPLVRGSPDDSATQPRGRARNTQKLLITAAVVMSIYLAGASAVTTLLIPEDALSPDGAAANRALAYLAHGEPLRDGHEARAISPLFGEVFGTVYDASTVVILCLAGASVTIGLRDLVPPYLHRLGMQLHWAYVIGAILYVFNLIKLCVTLVFHADVSAQRGALATSMLVLLTSASVAAAIDRRPGTSRLRLKEGSGWFVFATIVFALATAAVVVTKPGGLQIAFWCILATLVLSMVSRAKEHRAAVWRFRVRRRRIPVPLGQHESIGVSRPGAPSSWTPGAGNEGRTHPSKAPAGAGGPGRFCRSAARRHERVLSTAALGGQRRDRALPRTNQPGDVRRPCHRRGRSGVVEGRQVSRNPFRLVRRAAAGREPELCALRRGQHPLDGARTHPPSRARARSATENCGGLARRSRHVKSPDASDFFDGD